MSFSGGVIRGEPVSRARVAGVSVIACMITVLGMMQDTSGPTITWRACQSRNASSQAIGWVKAVRVRQPLAYMAICPRGRTTRTNQSRRRRE